LAPEAQRKGLQLVVDCVPSVPHVLSTDPVRLRQMLMNLVGNAVKFTHRGGVWVKLQARPTDDPTRVVLELQVKDTGIGFDASVNESLFSPFFQVDGSTTRMYGGTGLGLAITRSLVKCMQGEITASSAPGQGAVFHVSLPCGVLQLMEPLSTDAQAQAAVRAGDALNILLAEDHAINQKVMSMMLSKLGHQVTVAENGRVAMNHLRQKHFDLVLLDAMMPVMDGLQMLAELRAIEAREGGHCPVIMVTAHAMTGDAEKYLGAGADGYLPKPVSMKSLEDEIVRVMGLTRCLM
jgi:CheY-like chemotaxis protein